MRLAVKESAAKFYVRYFEAYPVSRITNRQVDVPSGVEVEVGDNRISVKGTHGEMNLDYDSLIDVRVEEGQVRIDAEEHNRKSKELAGTMASLVGNSIVGVTQKWEKRLQLQGVGYRARMQGKSLNLTLGFSHPIDYDVPTGIEVTTPSQTEIVVSGIDRQQVGQVAAEIRGFRPPEPYKGKGVRYQNERVSLKEGKK